MRLTITIEIARINFCASNTNLQVKSMEIPIQVLEEKRKRNVSLNVVNYTLELKSEEEILMYR